MKKKCFSFLPIRLAIRVFIQYRKVPKRVILIYKLRQWQPNLIIQSSSLLLAKTEERQILAPCQSFNTEFYEEKPTQSQREGVDWKRLTHTLTEALICGV